MKKLIFMLAFLLLATPVFAADKIRIQVQFTEKTDIGEYSDCLYFTQEDYAKLKQEDIDLLKKQRVDNWLEQVKNPPAPIELTEEQLITQKAQLEEQKAGIEAQISGIQAKITQKQAIKEGKIQ